MSNLNDEYEKIIGEIEAKITDREQLKFVKSEINKLTVLLSDPVIEYIKKTEKKIHDMEEMQDTLGTNLITALNKIKEIENFIYEEDDEDFYDFEVVCPYCNHQFYADVDLEKATEIKCPECKNIIELDWNDDESENKKCNGSCNNCSSCKEDYNNEIQRTQQFEINLEDDDEDI